MIDIAVDQEGAVLPGPVDGAVVGEDVVADVCSGVVCCAEFVGLCGISIGLSKRGSITGKSFQYVKGK